MTYGRNSDIGVVQEELGSVSSQQSDEHLQQLKTELPRTLSHIVSCPLVPVMIPGITAADALDAGDCMGIQFAVKVPRHGILQSALLLDFDDEGTQIDLELFKQQITQIANDAAWAPSDIDMLQFVTELSFFAFDDHINGQSSELLNIGKAYTAPTGFLWIQAVTRSTPTIAAGASPRIQLHIVSDDVSFVE